MTQQLSSFDNASFYDMLRILFANPCLILMLGEWRTGKTDTSLLIGYLAKKWGLIKEIGSNIFTFNSADVSYITSMGALRRWLVHDRETKLFIFDEALSHLPSRSAMSKLNVDMIKIIAELSKAHGRMIFCSQTEKVEGTLKDTAFLRAIMIKKAKTVLTVRSNLFEDADFSPVPRSPIRFDPDRLAEFKETDRLDFDTLSLEGRVAYLYMSGYSQINVIKSAPIEGSNPRQTFARCIKKVLRAYFERESLTVAEPPARNAPQETEALT